MLMSEAIKRNVAKARQRLALELKGLLQRFVHGLDRLTVPLAIFYLNRYRPDPPSTVSGTRRYMLCCYRLTPGTNSLSVEIPTLYETLKTYSSVNKAPFSTHFWKPTLASMFASFRFATSVLKESPSHLMLSSYTAKYHYMPAPAILRYLKRRGVCVVNLWWDTCSNNMGDAFLSMDTSVDLHVVLDNPCLYFLNQLASRGFDVSQFAKRVAPLFYPFHYSKQEVEKNIDAIFLGRTGSYRSVRMEYLRYLAEQGQQIVTPQDFPEELSEDDYDGLLQRSTLGINFSKSVDTHQLKARVFELIKSGCLVLEQRNDQTARYFDEGTHFVGFSSKEELLEKLRFYLNNETERRKICDAAYDRASTSYNGDMFWQAVFHACKGSY